MTKPANTLSRRDQQDVHERFLAMLPQIQEQARVAFRHCRQEQRDEFVAEVIANAYRALLRLAERGKLEVAYPTPLAQYAIRQIRFGRRVGGKLNARDISSRHCQTAKGVAMERLDGYDADEEVWKELLVEDRRATPADVAASRIDFSEWLRSLPRRTRRIAETLARGESTSRAAHMFGVSAGRISQLRRELRCNWEAFQGEGALGLEA